MLFAKFHLNRIEGLKFYKLFGSGIGEGFTPIQNTRVYAILTVWDNSEKEQIGSKSPIIKSYQRWASENWTLNLKTTSVRGKWSTQSPFTARKFDSKQHNSPIVVLTRATIKPKILLKFFGHVPSISKVIGDDPNVIFKIGLAELPFLHQVTFSIWPDIESMIKLQNVLKSRGYDVGKVDGILGAKTRQAVRLVQLEFGLSADSWPTKDLLKKLSMN